MMKTDDTGSIEGKIMHVENLLKNAPEYLLNKWLLLATKEQLLRVDNGFVQAFHLMQEMAHIRNLTFRREKILEVYIKLEVILTELIKIKIIGFDLEKMTLLEEMLKNMQMHRKREILKASGVIDKKFSSQLEKLSSVRNELAHSWMLMGVKYKGYLLKDNFESFKVDFENSWTKVIEIYMKEQTRHIDCLIERLENDLTRKHID